MKGLHLGYPKYTTDSNASLENIQSIIENAYEDMKSITIDFIHDDLEDAYISIDFDGYEHYGKASTYIVIENVYFRDERTVYEVMEIIKKELSIINNS